MTSTCEMEVICPSCKHEYTITVWHRINATLDPDLRTRLFQEKVNVGVCDVCGERAFMPVPILYHDMERQFCVMFYPFDLDYWANETLVDFFTAEGKLAESIPVYEPHIVLSFGEMLRYIQLRETIDERRNLGAEAC